MPSTTRQALLQALSAAGGAYISGQQLAGQLGVSRAAVHKAAAALTAQGYALEAVSRRGYRLLGGDPFCAEAVGPYPAPVQVYDTLESSNRTAKLLALDGAPHGTLVLTAHQSAGRGRLGRVFESPSGKGVYLSVLLRPAVPAASAQTATIGRPWRCAGRYRSCAGWNWASSGSTTCIIRVKRCAASSPKPAPTWRAGGWSGWWWASA